MNARERHANFSPSEWVLRHAGAVPRSAPVIDIACGKGRHGRHFLALGHPVTLVDRNVSGLTDLADQEGVDIIEADLETGEPWPLSERTFAGVVVTNYLWRPNLPAIIALVAPGGVLIYETFAVGNEVFGRPRHPDFLVRPGELLDAVRGHLHVVAYEQHRVETPRPAVIQRLAARR